MPKKKPKNKAVYSAILCDNCASSQCVFSIGDIKIPCANLKRGDSK